MGAEVGQLVRVEAVAAALDRLRQDFGRWLQASRAADTNAQNSYVGRHETQLGTIGSTLSSAANELAISIDSLKKRLPLVPAQLYEALRDLNQAIVWLERLWRFFADKLDQHVPRTEALWLRPLVQAADEVIWSCYQPAMLRIGKTTAAPVAYIAPEYSPAAMEVDRPLPADLQLAAEIPGLESFLENLPLPLLRLPAWCRESPWWLVYVGHEMGHHIQRELGLVKQTSEGLAAAASRVDPGAGFCSRWAQWGEEIFADAWSVHTMGQWALRALGEVEWSGRDAMLRPRGRYPSPVIRLSLMSQIVSALRLPEVELPGPLSEVLEAPLPPVIEADLKVIPHVVDFLMGPMLEQHTLADLASFRASDFFDDGNVSKWAAALASPDDALPPLNGQPALPRLIASAALQAWINLADTTDIQKRAQLGARVAARALDVLPRSGPPGTRAGGRAGDASDKGGELFRCLIAAQAARRQGIAENDAVPD